MDVKSAARSTKNFVSNNRVFVAVTLTTAVFVALNKRNAKEIDKFLESKGIDPNEYWTPEEDV